MLQTYPNICRYYLPDHIREHVDYITPGVKFSPSLTKSQVKRSPLNKPHMTNKPHKNPGPQKWNPPKSSHPWHMPAGAGSLPPDLQDCGRNITPVCIKALYDIPNPHLTDNVNSLGLFESNDAYAQEDLDLFFKNFSPNVPQGTHPILESINGGEAPVAPDSELNAGESVIDMSLAYALIYVSSQTFILPNPLY